MTKEENQKEDEMSELCHLLISWRLQPPKMSFRRTALEGQRDKGRRTESREDSRFSSSFKTLAKKLYQGKVNTARSNVSVMCHNRGDSIRSVNCSETHIVTVCQNEGLYLEHKYSKEAIGPSLCMYWDTSGLFLQQPQQSNKINQK